MTTILTCMKWHLIVVLIYISLMIHDIENLFMLPVDHLYFSFKKKNIYLDPLPIFKLDCLFFAIELY